MGAIVGADFEATGLQNQLQHAPDVCIVIDHFDQGWVGHGALKNKVMPDFNGSTKALACGHNLEVIAYWQRQMPVLVGPQWGMADHLLRHFWPLCAKVIGSVHNEP